MRRITSAMDWRTLIIGQTVVLSATLVVVAVALLIERAWPARTDRSGDHRVNLQVFAIGQVCKALLVPALGGAVTSAVNTAGGGWIALPTTGWGLVGSIAIYILAMDLGEYLFHRAQHAVPWLWAMHSLHHSDPAFGVGSAGRHFWAEPLIKSVTVWAAVALLFKTPPAAVGVYALLMMWNWFVHMNARLGFGRLAWLLNAPDYHRLHHSSDPAHYGSNFAALFPIFDVIAGSYRPMRDGERPLTGIPDRPSPQGWREVVLWPLPRARRTSVELVPA